MPNACIFCESGAGSREHLWPKWILERRDFGPFRLKRPGQPEVILNNTEMTVKSVCGNCNNGWMSRLESEAKPILEQMFEEKPITLDRMQQQIVALWITKMAFLYDSTKGRNATNLFYEKSEGLAIAQRQIPQFTGIWIGRLDEEHRSADGADFTMLFPDKMERTGEGSSLTLANEHFVAQIVSVRLKEIPKQPTALSVQPKPGDWENMLIPIWPIQFNELNWPPPVAFTNGGQNGYAYLMDRWRIGEPVQRINRDGVEELDQSKA